MNISADDRVNEFLNELRSKSPEQFVTVSTIRDLFFKIKRSLGEEIKYGGLGFRFDNSLIGGIFTYKNHVSIEFSSGSQFKDTSKTLEGGGKHRRHIKIHCFEDIADKKCKSFIRQSIAFKNE